jgi:hypothetical protein
MRMPSATRRRLFMLALVAGLGLGGCVHDCACGSGQPGRDTAANGGSGAPSNAALPPGTASPAPQPMADPFAEGGAGMRAPGAPSIADPSSAAPAAAAPVPGALPPTAASAPGVAAAAPEPVAPPPPPPPPTLESLFPDLPEHKADSARLKQLAHKAEVTAENPNTPLATPAALRRILPASVAGTTSAGPSLGPTRAGEKSISVVSQLYSRGDHEIYVKITDTAQAAFMRDSVLKRLDTPGNAGNGFMHSRLVAGQPAIVEFYPAASNNKLTALVGNRYVVDVRITRASSPYDAIKVFEALPLSKLASQ